MAVDIRLACENIADTDYDKFVPTSSVKICTPGDVIFSDGSTYMSGHGTYVQKESLHASVAGRPVQTNKLISVTPLKTRYNGEIGDCVVGRITQVQQKRWKVDTNSRLDSVLLLSSVNLPDGELRRRSVEDELMMRQYLQEGDLISAEVKEIFSDGVLSLHTRSLKYGKLSQGTLTRVSPSLIKRSKTHFHNLPCGVSVILGNNGFVWIYPNVSNDAENTNGYEQEVEVISKSDREIMARVKNCILALSKKKCVLFDTSIMYAYEVSEKYTKAKDLLKPEVISDVVSLTRSRMKLELESS